MISTGSHGTFLVGPKKPSNCAEFTPRPPPPSDERNKKTWTRQGYLTELFQMYILANIITLPGGQECRTREGCASVASSSLQAGPTGKKRKNVLYLHCNTRLWTLKEYFHKNHRANVMVKPIFCHNCLH